ncbi:hypothetical protein SADUNF_Sadunf10G0174300 [Salix dunnii]|uniref:Uncharacterized protein n=1 Tax=Salix dunnii TaxID=1413687 RepID=A0A835JSV4_9ROSI|nr:hypothetical protein SADUNF_Sadunf10G0174300 [Salix dunnii]
MHCGRQLLTHVVNGLSTAYTMTRNVKMRKAAMIFLMDIFFRDSANFEWTMSPKFFHAHNFTLSTYILTPTHWGSSLDANAPRNTRWQYMLPIPLWQYMSHNGLVIRREMQGLERREERSMVKDRDGGACWLWCKSFPNQIYPIFLIIISKNMIKLAIFSFSNKLENVCNTKGASKKDGQNMKFVNFNTVRQVMVPKMVKKDSRKSWSLLPEGECFIPKDVPKFHPAVYGGEYCKTYVIKHPLFKALLDRTEEVFGFTTGKKRLACTHNIVDGVFDKAQYLDLLMPESPLCQAGLKLVKAKLPSNKNLMPMLVSESG